MVDTFFSDLNTNVTVRIRYTSGMSQYANMCRDFPFGGFPLSQKYIYTWSILKFLDVLKSYESETFISGVLDPAEQDYDTSWYPFFRRFLENLQK